MRVSRYNSNYNGYMCLYPPSGKVYISRHVVFNEDCLPFKDQHKHLVLNYKTSILQAWQKAKPIPEQQVMSQVSRSLPPQPTPLQYQFK